MRVRTVAELLHDGRQSVECAALRGSSRCAGGGWAWPQVGGAEGEGAWPDDNPHRVAEVRINVVLCEP